MNGRQEALQPFRRAERIVGWLQWLALSAVAALLLGFFLFHQQAMRYREARPGKADGIVVLTGDKGRIAAGVVLLQERAGRRMLISGVNAQVPEAVLKKLVKADDLVRCCIDFGPSAANTAGNAQEARDWAVVNHFDSLIIVTHDYHMARSLRAFRKAMPGVELHPKALVSTARFPYWFREYAKYLMAIISPRLAREGLGDSPRREG